jgi:hypothetical protein
VSDHERRARELFEAARRAAPAPELARQILERARREREPKTRAPTANLRFRTVGFAFALAAMAAGVALLLWTRAEPIERCEIAAEPPHASARMPENQHPSAKPLSATSGSAVIEHPHTLPPPTPKKPERARSLPEQLELLKQARDALRAGAAARALAVLDSYQHGRNSVDMSAEATLLRIEALVQLRRRAEANELVEGFVARHPDSPLVDRARSLASGPTEAAGIGEEVRDESKP